MEDQTINNKCYSYLKHEFATAVKLLGNKVWFVRSNELLKGSDFQLF